MRSTRELSMVIGLLVAALVAGCAGDRMPWSTEEAVEDHLLANKVKLALYADTQLRGRQLTVEAAHGVIQLRGVVRAPPRPSAPYKLRKGSGGQRGPQSSDGALVLQL